MVFLNRDCRNTLREHDGRSELLVTPFDAYLELESTSEMKHEWINGFVYAM